MKSEHQMHITEAHLEPSRISTMERLLLLTYSTFTYILQ